MGFKADSHRIVFASTSAGGDFKSAAIFDAIEKALKVDGPTLVNKVKGVYCFEVNGGPGGTTAKWIVDAKNGSGSVAFNGTGKPDVTITMKDSDLVSLMEGSLNPQKAFFQGKLKIKGNMGLAMKLQEFQKQAGQLKAKL